MVMEQAESASSKTAQSAKVAKLSEAKAQESKKRPIKRLQEKILQKNELIAKLTEVLTRQKMRSGPINRTDPFHYDFGITR